MSTLITRTLDMSTGEEGPRHDPYHVETRTVTLQLDGCPRITHELRSGLGVSYKINGAVLTNDEELAVSLWEQAAGLTVRDFDRWHMRIHECPRRCPLCHGKLSFAHGYVGETMAFCDRDGCKAGIVWMEPVTESMIQ